MTFLFMRRWGLVCVLLAAATCFAGCTGRIPEGCEPGGFGYSMLSTEPKNSEDQQPRMSGAHAVVVKLDETSFLVQCVVFPDSNTSCTPETKGGVTVGGGIEPTRVDTSFSYPNLSDRPKVVDVSFFAGPDPAVDALLAHYSYEPDFDQEESDDGRICETAEPEEDEYFFKL